MMRAYSKSVKEKFGPFGIRHATPKFLTNCFWADSYPIQEWFANSVKTLDNEVLQVRRALCLTVYPSRCIGARWCQFVRMLRRSNALIWFNSYWQETAPLVIFFLHQKNIYCKKRYSVYLSKERAHLRKAVARTMTGPALSLPPYSTILLWMGIRLLLSDWICDVFWRSSPITSFHRATAFKRRRNSDNDETHVHANRLITHAHFQLQQRLVSSIGRAFDS